MAMSAGTAVGYLTLDVSNFVSGLGRAMSSASSAFNSMSSTAEGKTRALGTTLASVGTMLTAGVTAPIISLGKSVIETGATFDATMDQVAAVSRKPGQSLIELKQDTQMLREEAIRLGSSTFYSAQEVADGMVIMSKAGWDAQDIMDGMGGVLDSASASGEDLSTVSTVLVDSLTAFGLSASHATDIADLFAQSANAGTLDIKDLGQSMKYAGPVASALGMSVTDTTAAITMMSKAGIKGSQAGTALRRILLNMTAPTEKQAAAMERLGISIDDGNGHFKSLQQVLRDVRSGVKNFDGSTVELQANLQKLAGAYGISGLNAILNLSDQEFEQIIHDMEYSGGVAKTTAQIMRDNVAGAWDEFKDKVEAAKIKVFDAIAPALQQLLGHLNNFMDGLNNKLTPQMGQFIAKIAAAAAAIGPLMTAFGALAVVDSKINGPLTNVIRTIGNLRGGFAKLVPDISSATSGIGAVMRSVGNNITNIVPITRAATKGAVGSFQEMVKGFESHVKAISKIPDRIGRNFSALGRVITGNLRSPLDSIRLIGKDTATTFENVERHIFRINSILPSAFRNIGKTIKSTIGEGMFELKADILKIGDAIRDSGTRIKSFFESLSKLNPGIIFDGLVKRLYGFNQDLGLMLGLARDKITEFVKIAPEALKTIGSGIKSAVGNAFKNLPSSIGSAFDSAFSKVVQGVYGFNQNLGLALGLARDKLTEFVKIAPEALSKTASGIATATSNAFKSIPSRVGSAFESVTSSIVQRLYSLNKDIGLSVGLISDKVSSVLGGIGRSISYTLGNVGASFQLAFESIGPAAKRAIGDAGAWVSLHFESIANKARDLFLTLHTAIGVNLIDMAEMTKSSFSQLGSEIKTMVGTFSAAFSSEFAKISSFASAQLPKMLPVVKSVGQQVGAIYQETVGPAFSKVASIAGRSFSLIANAGKLAFGVTIVGAIAAVIAAFAHLMNTNEQFREGVTTVVNSVKEAFKGLWDNIKLLGEYLAPVGQAFKAVFEDFCTTIAPIVLDILQSIANGLISLTDETTVVGPAFEAIGNTIQALLPIFQDVLNVATEMLRTISSLLRGDFDAAWRNAQHLVEDFGKVLSDIANLIDGAIGSALQGLADILRDLGFEEAANQVQNLGQNFNLFSSILDFVKGKFAEWGQQLATILGQVIQQAQEFGNRIAPALQTIVPVLITIAGVLGSVFLSAWTAAFSTIGNLVVTVINTIANVLNGIGHVITGIANVVTGVWNVISNVVMAIVSLFTGDLEGAANHLGEAFEGFGQIAGGVFDALGGAAETLGSIIEGVFGGIGDVVGGVADFIGGAVDNIVNFFSQGGAAAEDMSGKVSSSTESMAGSFESFKDRHGKALWQASFDEDRFGTKVTQTVQESTEQLNGLVSATDSAAEGVNGGTNKAVEAFRGLAEKGGSYLEQLGLSADASDSDIEAALNSMAGATDSYTGDMSSAFGDTGMDISSFASGVEGDTGVATASFEEMGAAIDAFGTKSQEAAETVSTSFQSVSDSISNSLTGATEQFTQFGTSSSETFLSITETVNSFVTSSQASFESFKLSASTVFDTLLLAVQNFSSQASVSLDAFVASISTSFTNAQTSVINFTLITSAALQQFNTSATATFTSLSTDIANAFLSLTTQVLASFQSLTSGITAQLTAAQVAVEGWVNVVTSSVSQVVTSVSTMSAELNTIAASWGTQFVATVTTSMNAAAAAMSSTLNQMASNMSSQTNSMLSTVRSNFNAMNSTVRAQTNQMNATITAFGTRATSQITSACSRMNSAVNSQFTAMASRVRSATTQMISTIQNFGTRMVSVGNRSMNQYKSAIQRGFEQVKTTITSASNQMVSILTQLVARFAQQGTAAGNSYKSALTGALGGLYGQLYSIGSYAIQGMAAGIASGSGAVVGAIRSVAAQAVAAAQAALKISSPSKVMRDKVGVWIPAGIAQGIENNSKSVLNAFNDLKSGLIELAQDAGRDWSEEGKAQVKKFSETIKQTLKSEQDKIERAWKLHYEHEFKVIEDEEAALNKEISDIKAAYADSASKEEIEEMTAAQNARLEELKSQKEELKDLYKTFGSEVLNVFNNAMQEVSEGISEELADKFQSIADTAAKALEDVQKKIESMTTKLQSYGELFTLEKDKDTDVEFVKLSSLQEQINAITRYGQNLEALKGKISETLLSEIVAMDVDKANKYTDYLLHMSDEALEQYNKLYEEKQRKAAEIATKFYQDKVEQIKDEYLKQLVDAFLASYEQIDGVTADTIDKFHKLLSEQDWSADAQELLNELTPLLPKALDSVYEETSKKLVEGAQELADESKKIAEETGQGIKITFGGVIKDIIDILTGAGKQASDALSGSGSEAGENFAGSIVSSVKDELGIHSPSKVFESLGEDTGAGFVQGIVKILSSGSPFEQFAEMTREGLDAIIEQLSVAGSERILPTVTSIADEIKDYIQKLVDGIMALNNKLIREFESTFTAFDTFIKSVASSVNGSAQSIVSSYNSMASAARSAASAAKAAASALREQAAAQSEANRVQAEANKLAASSSSSSGGSKLTTQSVTNNYSTVINSPVKVSAIEAMRTSARVQRSLAEGY